MKKIISLATATALLATSLASSVVLVANAAAQSTESQSLNFTAYTGGKGARDTVANSITVSAADIAKGDVTVYGGLFVPDEGNHFSSLCLQFAINDTFEHSSSADSLKDLHTVGGITMNGAYPNPYCFIEDGDAYAYDEVDTSSCNPALANPADWNPTTFMMNWRTGLTDSNGVPLNAVYYSETKNLPVFEYEVVLPKGLEAGDYVLSVYTDMYYNILGTHKVPMISDADAQQLQWGTITPLTITVEGESTSTTTTTKNNATTTTTTKKNETVTTTTKKVEGDVVEQWQTTAGTTCKASDAELKYKIDKVEGKAGESVKVNLSYAETPAVYPTAWNYALDRNIANADKTTATALECTRIQRGDWTGTMTPNAPTWRSVYAGSDPQVMTGDILLTFTFKIPEAAEVGTVYPLEMENGYSFEGTTDNGTPVYKMLLDACDDNTENPHYFIISWESGSVTVVGEETTTAAETTTTAATTTTIATTTTKATTTTAKNTTTTTLPQGDILWGDAQDDGDIDIADVVILNRSVAGTYTLTAQGALNADCDYDKTIDLKDSLKIKQYLAKLIEYSELGNQK